MRLRNKKTGEIIDIYNGEVTLHYNQGRKTIHFKSLEELEEWEDAPEEPKGYWAIDCFSPDGLIYEFTGSSKDVLSNRKDIGNYFETKEEAERAVEKLKAWKRLKDKGVTFDNSLTMFDLDGCVGIRVYIPKGVSTTDDFEIIFGGKE